MKYNEVKDITGNLIKIKNSDYNVSKHLAKAKYGNIFCLICGIELNIKHGRGSKYEKIESKKKFQISASKSHEDYCFYNHYKIFSNGLINKISQIDTSEKTFLEFENNLQKSNSTTNKYTKPTNSQMLQKVFIDHDENYEKLKKEGFIVNRSNRIILNWKLKDKLKKFYIIEIDKENIEFKDNICNIDLNGYSSQKNNSNPGSSFKDYLRNSLGIPYTKSNEKDNRIKLKLNEKELINNKIYLLIKNPKVKKGQNIKYIWFDSSMIINSLERIKLEKIS